MIMETDVKLTKLAKCAGCGAKVGAGTLVHMLEGFKTHEDPRLIVGYDKSDDASVYVIDENTALVQTTDFFPPIVDDPYLYGKIAATNALSDVYAMGGEPKLALNIMCLAEHMDKETVQEILRGGYDTAYDAGAIITNREEIADKVRVLGNYGSDYKYHHIYQGHNSRLDEMQAAFLNAKLPHLERMNEERRRIADKYLEGIKNPEVILPFVPDYANPVWHIFGIRCKRRNELEKFLNDAGIGTNKHYPIPMHLQECYKNLGFKKGDFPVAEKISETELSIPIFYGMTDEQVSYVIEWINRF